MIPVPMIIANTGGRSHTFANAQGQQYPSKEISFFVYIVQDYSIATITNQLMLQTQTKLGAFIESAKLEVDRAFRTISNNMAFEIFRDGTGTRGFIASATTVGTATYALTLTNVTDVVNFEINMTLINYAISGNPQVVSAISSTTALITAVDRTNGILTVLASSADTSWLTVGNAIGVSGDVVAGTQATGSTFALQGLQAWLPVVEPSSTDNFWNVNRSVDPLRLSGIRYNGASLAIDEALIGALQEVQRNGADPDLIVMNPTSFGAFLKLLQGKSIYRPTEVKNEAVDVSFQGIELQTGNGPIRIISDRSCPNKTAFVLTMSTWSLRTLGKAPQILTYGMEGLEGLRVYNADALEVRVGYYGQLLCSAPGMNAVVTLSE